MLLYSYADIVQWLVCGLAKAEMRVQFSLFAPNFIIYDIIYIDLLGGQKV